MKAATRSKQLGQMALTARTAQMAMTVRMASTEMTARMVSHLNSRLKKTIGTYLTTTARPGGNLARRQERRAMMGPTAQTERTALMARMVLMATPSSRA